MTKTMAVTDALREMPFMIDSVAEADAPDGSDDLWHHYTIKQGGNTITGMRSGTRAQVMVALDDMIERLNERRLGKSRPKTKGHTPAAAATPARGQSGN
jgi:hypothetical protein